MMKRLLITLTLILGGSALFASNIEQLFLFHFNKTRIHPSEAGEPGLREVSYRDLVLWVAHPEEGRPTILYFHGNAGNLANRVRRFSAFINRGFGVVAMGYPGSSGSDGRPSVEGIQQAANMLYRDLSSLTGPGSVILYGESMGTGVVVELAASTATDPDKGAGPPAAMVLEAPFTSIKAEGIVHYPRLAPLIAKLPDWWDSQRWIAHIDAPLLILHGARDSVVPVEMARTLYAQASTTDKQIHIEEGAGHNDVWQPDAQNALFTFLSRF
jgi:pimeloyl-ACP methyl ester carboxylesterase